MAKFSVVMPVHNEERLLPYSLPSVYQLNPDELVLIFDRCEDKSLQVAIRIAKLFNFTSKTKFINLNEASPDWKFRTAFVRRRGYKIAKNNIILNTDADNLLDEKIRKYLNLVGKSNIGMISFSRKQYPPTFQHFVAKLISILPKNIGFRKAGFSGLYAFSKKAWQDTEKEASAKNVIKAEDTHLHLSMLQKYDYRFVKTNTIHLRPREEPTTHYLRGIMYWKLKRNPLWKAVLHSIIYFRPFMLVGYLHARYSM